MLLSAALLFLLLTAARAGRPVWEMLPRVTKHTCSCPLDDAAQSSSLSMDFEGDASLIPRCWTGDRLYSCIGPLPIINCRCMHSRWEPPVGDPTKGLPPSDRGFVFAYGVSRGCGGAECFHDGWTSATQLGTVDRVIDGNLGFVNTATTFTKSFATPARRHRQEL